MRIYNRCPAYFRFVQQWIAADKRGGYLLSRLIYELHKQFGILDACAPFLLPNHQQILIPLYWPLLLEKARLETYEQHQIRSLALAIDRMGKNTTFIDCGADVGVVSRLVLQRSRSISLLYAFEPNPQSYFVLERNLANMPIECRPSNAAVSDFEGQAKLLYPSNLRRGEPYYDHSGFIRRGDGNIRVTTIDALELSPHSPVSIKIDVEGEELQVLKGARETLRSAPDFVVQVEAHADVYSRTGIDPCEFWEFLLRIRDVSATVINDTHGIMERKPRIDRPFFEQYSMRSCDILFETKSA